MKLILLIFIVLISYYATRSFFPPVPLITLYGFFAVAPAVLILLRKNLVNSLLLWFLFVVFHRLWRIQIPIIPDMTLYRIVWIVMIVYFFIDVAMKKRKLVPSNIKIELTMIIYSIYILFSGIIAGTIITKNGIILEPVLMGNIMPYSIYFLAKNLIDDEKKFKKALMYFSLIGLYLGLTGIFEHFRLDFLVWPQFIMNPSIGIHFGQARGPFVQAGINGMMISLLIFMTTYLYLNETRKSKKFFLVMCILFLLTTLLFTYNRASWFGFALASLIFPVFYRRLRLVYAMSSVLLVLFLLIGYSVNMFQFDARAQAAFQSAGSLSRGNLDVKTAVGHRFQSKDSLYSRINIFVTQMRMIREKPVFGFGYHRFKKDADKFFAPVEGIPFNIGSRIASQSGFMVVLVELGLLGFIIYLFLLYAIIDLGKKLYCILPKDGFFRKEIVGILAGTFIVYFIGYQFREARTNMICNSTFFFIVGTMSGLYERVKMQKQES